MALYDPGAGETYIVEEGRLQGHEGFIPHPLPPSSLDANVYQQELLDARDSLDGFNRQLSELSDTRPFIQFIAAYEASRSSRIEGIDEDVRTYYRFKATGEYPSVLDSYVEALFEAADRAVSGRLTLDGLCELHAMTMEGTSDYEDDRFIDTEPGELRDGGMLIGDPDELHTDEEYYIAPPPSRVPELLEDLLDYFNSETSSPALVDAMLLHAQFEMIHGFADGNGRMGRILVSAYLHARGESDAPSFGWSRVLEAEQDEYFAQLGAISHRNRWNDWVRFGLASMGRSAEFSGERLDKLLETIEEDRQYVVSQMHSSRYNEPLFDHVLNHPVTTARQVTNALECSRQTAYNRLDQFWKEGLVSKVPSDASSLTMYEYGAFFDVFERPENRHRTTGNTEADSGTDSLSYGRWNTRSNL